MKRCGSLLIVLLLTIVCSGAWAFKLPDTGQIICYDMNGNVIPCAGTGQDGAYAINAMSFTDNGNGTVTDNNTGLIWQKEDNDTDYNWYQASGTFDAAYNPSTYSVCGSLSLGGYSDWRLPSKKELMTIVDYGVHFPGPTINATYFPNTQLSFYWSSTPYADNPYFAWSVNFRDGGVDHDRGKGDYYYVRCMHGGQSPSQNLIDNGNGTVTDNVTGLLWQQGEPGPMRWDSALSYCEGLYLAGHSDWRLPNIKELESLTSDTRYNPAIDTNFFPSVIASAYWSSTTNAYVNPSNAWFVHFYDGHIFDYEKSLNHYYVRCVRGGLCTPPNIPVLSSPQNGATGVATTPFLDWGDVSGATSYDVQVCSDSNCSSVVRSANVTESQWIVSPALVKGTTYYWRVRSVNACGPSSWSGIRSFTTCTNPLRPTLVSPANGATGVATAPTLDWGGVSEATSYDVRVCSDSNCSTVVRSKNVTNSQWTVSPALNEGTTYYWRVRSKNSCGTSL
jgi:hypothetical protein